MVSGSGFGIQDSVVEGLGFRIAGLEVRFRGFRIGLAAYTSGE